MKKIVNGAKQFFLIMLCFAIVSGTLAGCQSGDNADNGSENDYVAEGDELLKKGDYIGAGSAYKNAIDANDKNELAYLGLAEAYLEQGDAKRAKETLDTALNKIGEDNLTLKYAKLLEKVEAGLGGTNQGTNTPSGENISVETDIPGPDGNGGISTSVTPIPGEIVWTDSALETIVREKLGIANGPVLEEKVASITDLDISNKGVSDISNLRYMPSLTYLWADNNRITDISVLTGLRELKEVHLNGNPIENPEKVLEIDKISILSLPDITKSLTYLLRKSGKISELYINGKEDFRRLSSTGNLGKRQVAIENMNSEQFELESIDIYAHNTSVGERNKSYKWDQTAFYALEGITSSNKYKNKNLCRLIKKELKNAVTGNIIDYEIYIDPNTGIANKIVSIEYIDNGLEIMEFYFDTDAKANFVFHYFVDNYISTFATPTMPGERFLFNKDVLVTWRDITSSSTTNYVVGSNEAERLKSSWESKSIKQYDSLSNDLKSKFDRNEVDMLNAAYNTYNAVMNAEGIARIQGYVYNEDSDPVSEAIVSLYSEDVGALLYTEMTDKDGSYSFYVPSDEYQYKLVISKDGFDDVEIYGIVISTDEIGAYQDSAYLFREGGPEVTVYLTLGDAFNKSSSGIGMQLLRNAKVYFRRGMNNRYGEVLYQGNTDQNGYISINIRQGVYTIEVDADGYETMYYTIRANQKENNKYEFYSAPSLGDNEVAIVLTWGEYPSDLDSHLFTTTSNTTKHIWYGNKTDSNGNYLDVDDTSSYGPETITIRNFNNSNYYKYCVVDYSNCSCDYFGSYSMSNSGATVNVYTKDGLIASYHVPTNIGGVIWEVFEIRNGRVTTIQRYYDNVSDKSWWHEEK